MIPILRIIPDAIGALLRLVGLIKAPAPAPETDAPVVTAGGSIMEKKTAAVVTLVCNVVLGVLAILKFLKTGEVDQHIVSAMAGTTGGYALLRGVEGTLSKTKGPPAA